MLTFNCNLTGNASSGYNWRGHETATAHRSIPTPFPARHHLTAQEVIAASQALDGRHRSDYDQDEHGEEEREL
jgi:hypothetical protein